MKRLGLGTLLDQIVPLFLNCFLHTTNKRSIRSSRFVNSVIYFLYPVDRFAVLRFDLQPPRFGFVNTGVGVWEVRYRFWKGNISSYYINFLSLLNYLYCGRSFSTIVDQFLSIYNKIGIWQSIKWIIRVSFLILGYIQVRISNTNSTYQVELNIAMLIANRDVLARCTLINICALKRREQYV